MNLQKSKGSLSHRLSEDVLLIDMSPATSPEVGSWLYRTNLHPLIPLGILELFVTK